jgi:hypothetical protein
LRGAEGGKKRGMGLAGRKRQRKWKDKGQREEKK